MLQVSVTEGVLTRHSLRQEQKCVCVCIPFCCSRTLMFSPPDTWCVRAEIKPSYLWEISHRQDWGNVSADKGSCPADLHWKGRWMVYSLTVASWVAGHPSHGISPLLWRPHHPLLSLLSAVPLQTAKRANQPSSELPQWWNMEEIHHTHCTTLDHFIFYISCS